ncbi:hypothetical protein LXL04_033426 [Taraxacum kok-saghyz]
MEHSISFFGIAILEKQEESMAIFEGLLEQKFGTLQDLERKAAQVLGHDSCPTDCGNFKNGSKDESLLALEEEEGFVVDGLISGGRLLVGQSVEERGRHCLASIKEELHLLFENGFCRNCYEWSVRVVNGIEEADMAFLPRRFVRGTPFLLGPALRAEQKPNQETEKPTKTDETETIKPKPKRTHWVWVLKIETINCGFGFERRRDNRARASHSRKFHSLPASLSLSFPPLPRVRASSFPPLPVSSQPRVGASHSLEFELSTSTCLTVSGKLLPYVKLDLLIHVSSQPRLADSDSVIPIPFPYTRGYGSSKLEPIDHTIRNCELIGTHSELRQNVVLFSPSDLFEFSLQTVRVSFKFSYSSLEWIVIIFPVSVSGANE